MLTERLGKTTLNTSQQTLTVHSLIRVAEVLQIVLFRETWIQLFLTSWHKTYSRRRFYVDLCFTKVGHESYT